MVNPPVAHRHKPPQHPQLTSQNQVLSQSLAKPKHPQPKQMQKFKSNSMTRATAHPTEAANQAMDIQFRNQQMPGELHRSKSLTNRLLELEEIRQNQTSKFQHLMEQIKQNKREGSALSGKSRGDSRQDKQRVATPSFSQLCPAAAEEAPRREARDPQPF